MTLGYTTIALKYADLKEYSAIVTTSFCDKNPTILTQRIISKISVDSNISFTSYAW